MDLSGVDGTVIFNLIKPGSYTVQASKGGFESSSYSIKAVEGATTDVTITLDVTTNNGSLKITAKDENGASVSGVTITSTSQPNGQLKLSGTTNSAGETIFSEVLPGSYTIQAAKTGYTSLVANKEVSAGSTVTLILTLQTSKPITSNLKVTIKDQSGVALSGVSILSTTQPSGQSQLSGTTGSDGSIIFTGVELGSYTVQVSKTGFKSNSGTGTVSVGGSNVVNISLQAESSGGIPGYPVESILLGIISVASLFIVSNKRITPACR